jgi:hypothetical protein
LDALFNNLALRASRAEYISQMEKYLHLGLKAQSQCRQTLQALGELKNPRRTVFIKQTNTAGQQIVSNGAASSEDLKNSGNPTNELLEHTHGERLDFGETAEAGRIDMAMETVDALHRTDQ